jgi:hypothetical protein
MPTRVDPIAVPQTFECRADEQEDDAIAKEREESFPTVERDNCFEEDDERMRIDDELPETFDRGSTLPHVIQTRAGFNNPNLDILRSTEFDTNLRSVTSLS